MNFTDNELRATSLIKGIKIELSPEFLAEVLGFLNDDRELYYSHREVSYAGYSKEQAIRELMEGKYDSIDVSKLSVLNRFVLFVINQMVILQVGKSNFPTFLEIFY